MVIGVLGLGSIGQRHRRNLLDLGHEVIGYDVNPQCEGVTITSLEGFWKQSLDAVLICSPARCHYDHAMDAIDRRVPLFVEKPLALRSEDAWAIVEAAALYKVPLAVGYQMRCLQPLKALKEKLRTATPLWACAWFSYDIAKWHANGSYTDRIGIGLEASHEIDYLLWLFGAPVQVNPLLGIEDGHDVAVHALWIYHTGFCVSLHLDQLGSQYMRGMLVQFRERHALQLSLNATDEQWNTAYREEIERFLAAVKTDDPSLIVASGKDGVRAIAMIEEMKRSAGHRP